MRKKPIVLHILIKNAQKGLTKRINCSYSWSAGVPECRSAGVPECRSAYYYHIFIVL